MKNLHQIKEAINYATVHRCTKKWLQKQLEEVVKARTRSSQSVRQKNNPSQRVIKTRVRPIVR
jgi:hypothetical protein